MMKITGTNSYIVLDIDFSKIKVQVEMVVGGFIAEINTMQQFEPPYENITLTESVKEMYINEAVKKTANSHMIIRFV